MTTAPTTQTSNRTTQAARLTVVTDTAPAGLHPDAHQLAAAFLAHHHGPGGNTVPAGRALRRDHLPGWSRTRYAAAVRALLDAGLYVADRSADGTWQVRVTVPRGGAR